jgi:hypothetical protein
LLPAEYSNAIKASSGVCQNVLDEDSVNESLCKKLSEQEVSKAPDNRASPIKLLIDFIVVAFKI